MTDNPASSLRRLAITASENPTRKLQRRGDDDRNGVGIPLPEAATTVTVYSARRSVPPAPPLTQSTIRTSAPNRIATVVLWRLGPAKDYRRLLRYLKSIVYFDTEVADGARAWHVRGEVALLPGSAVNERRFVHRSEWVSYPAASSPIDVTHDSICRRSSDRTAPVLAFDIRAAFPVGWATLPPPSIRNDSPSPW